MSKRNLRKRYFVDRTVQGALLARAVRYWAISVSVVAMLTVAGWVFVTPGVAVLVDSPDVLVGVLGCLAVAMGVSTLLLPVVLYDLIRFSHRFAGPMIRLSESMQRVGEGRSVEPLVLRDDDFWGEFADAFNAMQTRLQEKDDHGSKSSASPENATYG